MASSRPPPSKSYDLELTIVSAKHIKNVNWRHGDLKPYAIFWVDPERRQATKLDDSGSTRPVWNERFVLPLTLPPHDSLLTVEIFHSKPSETPKPLVGTLRLPLKDAVDLDGSTRIGNFELLRPSGRPHGKIRLKLAVRERLPPDYPVAAPPPSYYYSSPAVAAAPPLPARDFRGYSFPPHPPPSAASQSPPPPLPPHSYPYGGYSDPYSSYYGGYYAPPPPPTRPFLDRQSSYGGGPSAPMEYNGPYDHKQKGAKPGFGTGLAVGAVAGALGGLALEEGLKYEEEKIADGVESDFAARDDYSDYRDY